MLVRIPVDFNTATADLQERVSIPTHVYPDLLEILKPGMLALLYEEHDIEVQAVLEFDEEYEHWFGVPDWSTLRDLGANSEPRT